MSGDGGGGERERAKGRENTKEKTVRNLILGRYRSSDPVAGRGRGDPVINIQNPHHLCTFRLPSWGGGVRGRKSGRKEGNGVLGENFDPDHPRMSVTLPNKKRLTDGSLPMKRRRK